MLTIWLHFMVKKCTNLYFSVFKKKTIIICKYCQIYSIEVIYIIFYLKFSNGEVLNSYYVCIYIYIIYIYNKSLLESLVFIENMSSMYMLMYVICHF